MLGTMSCVHLVGCSSIPCTSARTYACSGRVCPYCSIFNTTAPSKGPPAAGGGQTGDLFRETDELRNPADAAAAGFYITNARNWIYGNAASGGWTGFSFPNVPYPLGAFAGLDFDRSDIIFTLEIPHALLCSVPSFFPDFMRVHGGWMGVNPACRWVDNSLLMNSLGWGASRFKVQPACTSRVRIRWEQCAQCRHRLAWCRQLRLRWWQVDARGRYRRTSEVPFGPQHPRVSGSKATAECKRIYQPFGVSLQQRSTF
jgi:hypothetical protein